MDDTQDLVVRAGEARITTVNDIGGVSEGCVLFFGQREINERC